jgi:FAD-dependent oxidoreductase domain-containing protein 1
MNAYDVVIVGGGAVGSSIAYFLSADPSFAGRVAVVERDPAYRQASSALSASSIRQQFSTPLNIALSRFGIGFLRNVTEHLGVDGEPVVLGLKEPGYLFLASAAGEPVLRANHAVQRAEGCAVELLDPPALRRRFPFLSTDGIVLGSHGVANEGWFDGPALLQAFRRKARAQGVTYIAAEATGFERNRGRITGVRLGDGTTLAAGTVVIAAGPWSGKVGALAGIVLPVEARRRSVFVFDCRAPIEGTMPLVIDPTGAWCRPEGQYFLGGISPPEADDPADQPLEVVHSQWDELVWPVVAGRVPAFATVKVVNAWAGYYEYNTFDQNGIVGRHPEIANLLIATGFSGHGIQQSPATGRAVSELIVDGRYRTLDLTPFGFERIAARQPIRELNVV